MSTDLAPRMVREYAPEEDDLVYCVELPTLQQIASYRVSLAIWYGYISSPKLLPLLSSNIIDWLPYLGARSTYETDIDKLIEDLKTPRRIEEMLKKATKKVVQELNSWALHLGLELFPNVIGECSLPRIDSRWCVWMANGEINYRKSAEKMLDSGKLNYTRKFVIASKYCMEDRVKTISLKLLSKCVRNVNYADDPILFYWICYLRNELHKVPGHTGSGEADALDLSMACQCYGDRRMALEYFWHRSLNHPRHFSIHQLLVSNCTNDPRSWCIFERLFSSVDRYCSLPTSVEAKVIGSLFYSRSSPYPLRLWKYFKHLFTGVRFANFVREMLRYAAGDEEKMKLLIDVWNSADEHQKDFVIGKNLSYEGAYNSMFMTFVRPWNDPPCPTAFEFLSSYITDLSSRAERLHSDYIRSFLLYVPDMDFLNQILELFSVASDSLFELKIHTLESKAFLAFGILSVEYLNFDHLNAKLEWLCSQIGANPVRAFKKKILENVRPFIATCHRLLDFENWNKLCHFIDETYADETSKALKVKRTFVSALIDYCFQNSNFQNGFDNIKKIIEFVYLPKHLDHVKSKFLSSFGGIMKKTTYWSYEEVSYETFESVIDWCCGNDQIKISQFKKKVRYCALVTAVLNRLLDDNMIELRRPQLAKILLSRLQKHLVWHLGNKDDVNEYKLRRITQRYSNDLRIFNELKTKNESCLMVVLKWFFNGSSTQAVEFRLN